MNLQLGQDSASSAYLWSVWHKLMYLGVGHWNLQQLVLGVGWDLTQHLIVASPRGLSFLTTWQLGSNGEYS